MVNEMHKPPTEENVILGERLVASNRQLQQMQEEHNQLMQEMEVLRQRAIELSHLNPQMSENVEQSTNDQSIQNNFNTNSEEIAVKIISSNIESSNATSTTADYNEISSNIESSNATSTTAETMQSVSSKAEISKETELQNKKEENTDIELTEKNTESADYLQQKINEIAALKAQYKRVQNMISTTKLIEEHLESKNSEVATSTKVIEENETKNSKDLNINTNKEQAINCIENNLISQITNLTTTATASASSTATATTNPNSSSAIDENEELINAMMSLFTEFTTDLKGQAENLRAERERIKALKEEILSRRKQP